MHLPNLVEKEINGTGVFFVDNFMRIHSGYTHY